MISVSFSFIVPVFYDTASFYVWKSEFYTFYFFGFLVPKDLILVYLFSNNIARFVDVMDISSNICDFGIFYTAVIRNVDIGIGETFFIKYFYLNSAPCFEFLVHNR